MLLFVGVLTGVALHTISATLPTTPAPVLNGNGKH